MHTTVDCARVAEMWKYTSTVLCLQLLASISHLQNVLWLLTIQPGKELLHWDLQNLYELCKKEASLKQGLKCENSLFIRQGLKCENSLFIRQGLKCENSLFIRQGLKCENSLFIRHAQDSQCV